LGSFPEVSLASARDRAWERRRAYVNVRLPLIELKQLPELPNPTIAIRVASKQQTDGSKVKTFQFCAETYVAAQAPGWNSKKHAKQWLSTLKQYAFPVIGNLTVDGIGIDQMLKILSPIWSTKTETATRLRGRIECILDWAEHRGYRSGKNPARWGGNLKHELPSPTKLKKRKKKHHAALPYMRVGEFMVDLRSRQGISVRALEWGILTSTRSQEIRGARRSEIDTTLRRWTIPTGRMKMEKDHVVPLSAAAIALYESLPTIEGCDLLFPAPEGGELSDSAFGAIIDGMHEGDVKRGGVGYLDPKQNRIATQHGFRSTFRDWAAEIVFFPRDIIEHALAHKLKDAAEAAYQRGDMLLKRAVLMEQWAEFCSERTPRVPTAFDLSKRMAA
jgi:integrase